MSIPRVFSVRLHVSAKALLAGLRSRWARKLFVGVPRNRFAKYVMTGHDDAIAILLSLYEPSIELLGVSTVHGNASLKNTTVNAARCLVAFGGSQHSDIKVYPGAAKPLIGQSVAAVDIHGSDGLGGVEGLPAVDDPRVQERIVPFADRASLFPAISGLCVAATKALNAGTKLNVGVTGSFTNIALFLLTYPDLARSALQQIICMGGSVGFGNSASHKQSVEIDEAYFLNRSYR